MSKVFTITEGLENMGAMRTGGQGSVYKGRRIGPIITAVKLLPTPIYTGDENDKNFKTFRNEVDKLKKVNAEPNPNVVKILNSGLTESGSFPFIEMEYIEGPDLEELLKSPHEKIFTIKEAIKLADQLANALAHCHKVGVKHGDIKSNNIKYNIHSGNYVLLDFGLAVMSDEQRRTSMRHAGAIEFMAPEQNTGQMLFQTDIYSYGVILFELLAGQVPFPLQDDGETSRNTVMVAHMESPVPDLIKLRKLNLPDDWPVAQMAQEMRVPKWLLAIITKCLEKKPEKRYANGQALQDAIVEGSVEAVREEIPEKAATKAIVASAENAATQPALPDTDDDDGMIHISKAIFTGLMLLLLLSMGFAGYMLFTYNKVSKPDTVKASDSLASPNTDTTSEAAPVPSYRERRRAQDSLTQKNIHDEIEKQREKAMREQDSIDKADADSASVAQPAADNQQ